MLLEVEINLDRLLYILSGELFLKIGEFFCVDVFVVFLNRVENLFHDFYLKEISFF